MKAKEVIEKRPFPNREGPYVCGVCNRIRRKAELGWWAVELEAHVCPQCAAELLLVEHQLERSKGC